MKSPMLLAFILVIIVIKLKMSQADSSNNKANKKFWDRENKSMFIRKKSLETLDYIHIDSKSLPILQKEYCNEEVYSIQNKVLELIKLKIVNFQGKSNTDLKLEYGTANLDTLTMYEERYILLIKYIYKWGKALYDDNKIDEATLVLELGVTIKSDISKHYILLGKLYKIKKDTQSFNSLYSQIQQSEFVFKHKILNSLSSL
jgi:hypothetical protein